MSLTVLVTGSTGTIGSKVLHELRSIGYNVIAAVRGDASDETSRDGIHRRRLDYSDPATFESATEGVDAVFLIGPPLVLDLYQLLEPFIDHLAERKIRRVVYVAAMALEKVPSMPFHSQAIERLQQHGMELTVMKPTFFAQNFKNYEGENILERGVLFQPADDGKAAFVDAHDIAACVAAAFSNPATIGKEYLLTGPTALSYHDVAGLLSDILGRSIAYARPDADTYRSVLASAGAPPFVAEYMIDVYGLIRNGDVDLVTDHVQLLTGKPATPLNTVLMRDFS
ncbi:MAG: NmrA family NAD(P)-binding protein [Candidatus Kapabacteria bacterium]|jgi:uncharacterized protein YbjT (DUF2867 family)|nr:NmrA family NAD(P)-binding protein [Candidatus Kapabacteria bacterium]